MIWKPEFMELSCVGWGGQGKDSKVCHPTQWKLFHPLDLVLTIPLLFLSSIYALFPFTHCCFLNFILNLLYPCQLIALSCFYQLVIDTILLCLEGFYNVIYLFLNSFIFFHPSHYLFHLFLFPVYHVLKIQLSYLNGRKLETDRQIDRCLASNGSFSKWP